MAHIFNYAVLTAIPDPTRGERVNVGIVAFRPAGADVQFAELSKVRALAGGDWSDYAEDVRQRLIGQFQGQDAQEFLNGLPLDPIFKISDLAWFSADNEDEYAARIKQIMESLVLRPRGPSHTRTTRINTEIARQFKVLQVLATPEQTINDHKLVRDFSISAEEELVADFALRNGQMHVAATLDLRKARTRLDEAALKAVTLDKAKEVYPDGVRRIGVYAAPLGTHHDYRAHIELLKDYSDVTYNWLAPDDQRTFTRDIQKAAAMPFSFGS
jgi:hypothetical protein